MLFSISLPIAAAETNSVTSLFEATLNDIHGKPVALGKYRGRPLVINFWARWCPPCRREIPDLIEARKQLNTDGGEIVGIAIDDQTDPVRNFAQNYRIDYPVLVAKDKGMAIMRALGNTQEGLPYTVILNRHGRIVATRLGQIKKTEMAILFATASQ